MLKWRSGEEDGDGRKESRLYHQVVRNGEDSPGGHPVGLALFSWGTHHGPPFVSLGFGSWRRKFV